MLFISNSGCEVLLLNTLIVAICNMQFFTILLHFGILFYYSLFSTFVLFLPFPILYFPSFSLYPLTLHIGTASTGVSGLSFTTLNSTSLLITWNLPLEPNGNIDRYEVNAVLLHPRSIRKRQMPIVVVSGTSASITGLVSGAQYNITVQPFADGVGGEIVSITPVVNTTAAVPPIDDLPTENIQPFEISVMLPRPTLYGSVV